MSLPVSGSRVAPSASMIRTSAGSPFSGTSTWPFADGGPIGTHDPAKRGSVLKREMPATSHSSTGTPVLRE
jgi:hypothetical protein